MPEISELNKDKDKLLELLLLVAKKNKHRFTSKVYNDRKVNVNGVKVAVHVVKDLHVELHVIQEGETILKVRHLGSYTHSVNTVLNFININFL